jgi:hypothetical protein
MPNEPRLVAAEPSLTKYQTNLDSSEDMRALSKSLMPETKQPGRAWYMMTPEGWKSMKKTLLVSLALFVSTALGADINGNWKGTAAFGDNALERTFTFKVEGGKLTGETNSQMMGKSTINDGVVDGDNISFLHHHGQSTGKRNETHLQRKNPG